MKIDEIRPSQGRKGGWIVTVRPRTDWRKFARTFDAATCRELPSGRYWLSQSALDALKQHITGGSGDPQRQRTASPPPPLPPAPEKLSCFGALYLRDNAPWELVAAAHRVLAKAAHPDNGGSNERMLMLERAFDACKRARGVKK